MDGMYVIVYTSITIRYNNADLGGTNVRCQMWMNGKETGFTATYGKGIFGHCDHPLNDQQIGKKLIRVLLNSKYGIVDRQFTLIVLSGNQWPSKQSTHRLKATLYKYSELFMSINITWKNKLNGSAFPR